MKDEKASLRKKGWGVQPAQPAQILTESLH